jgi:nitrite reductase/ring-hydroxylating ferredoxin subunit
MKTTSKDLHGTASTAKGKIAQSVPYAVVDPERVDARRYFDKDFFDLESRSVWPRTWQMAGREEQIPHPGDYLEYSIFDKSVIVVRLQDNTIKAFHNACRHRGMPLAQKPRGNLRNGFRCPFHGWCYDLDGRNSFVFEPGLFSDAALREEDLQLRECRSERWAGWVFVTFEDDPVPLRQALMPFAAIAEAFNVPQMRVEWWRGTVAPVNWKLAMAAFMEGYHVMGTHPQLLPPNARGKNAFYRGGRLGSTREAAAAQKDSASIVAASIRYLREQGRGMEGYVHEKDIRVAEGLRNIELPDDPSLAAKVYREALNDAIVRWNRGAGIPIADINEIEAQGFMPGVYFAYPNFFLLLYFGNAVFYRFRPLGAEEILFEMGSMTLFPAGEEPEFTREIEMLAPDDKRWPLVPAQDLANLPAQQRGCHAAGFEFMRLSRDVEGLISMFEQLVDGYIAGLGQDELTGAAHVVSGPIDRPIRDLWV